MGHETIPLADANIAYVQNEHICNQPQVSLSSAGPEPVLLSDEAPAWPSLPSGIEFRYCGVMIALFRFRRCFRCYQIPRAASAPGQDAAVAVIPCRAGGAPPYRILHHGESVRASISCEVETGEVGWLSTSLRGPHSLRNRLTRDTQNDTEAANWDLRDNRACFRSPKSVRIRGPG
jgi:hypothetical protein